MTLQCNINQSTPLQRKSLSVTWLIEHMMVWLHIGVLGDSDADVVAAADRLQLRLQTLMLHTALITSTWINVATFIYCKSALLLFSV